MLGGLLAGAAVPAIASAPLTSIRPLPRGTKPEPTIAAVEALVRKANLGGHVSFAVADMATGEMLETRKPLLTQPPASVAKAITAAYALDRLGPEHRFATRLIASGPVEDGLIKGDLVLAGGGDPTLDTDGLANLVSAMKDRGVHGVTGRFRVWSGALPALPWIDADQPDHVGYNPAIGGLNLNFNRVHFQWKRSGGSYDLSMEARAERFSPDVGIARVQVLQEQRAVYEYQHRNGADHWSVARRALGESGSRWLPVRRPGAYAEETFLTVARSYGFDLKAGPTLDQMPVGIEIAREEGAALRDLLRGMLRYSTNLTAEVTGLSASAAGGGVPNTLAASAAEMNEWAKSRLGARKPGLVDHSGLGYGSEVSAADMVQMLMAPDQYDRLGAILRDFRVNDANGNGVSRETLAVSAKTGTLNFVSALAGYARARDGRTLAFAIFTSDEERRDAIPVSHRERPEGARGWARRSRRLQQDLLLRWAQRFSA